MKKKGRIGLLVAVMCLLFGSITAFAETKNFYFVINAEEYDAGTWLAEKEDSKQTAYIEPASITGSGRIWAAVYDKKGGTQYTYDVAIQPGDTDKKEAGYYKTGVVGRTYRLLGGDSEWEVTSAQFKVSGQWTP